MEKEENQDKKSFSSYLDAIFPGGALHAPPSLKPSSKKQKKISVLKQTPQDEIETDKILKEKIEEALKKAKDANTIAVFGFIFLLVMVAQIVNDSYIAKNQSYNELLREIINLRSQQQIQQHKINVLSNGLSIKANVSR